MRVKVSWNDAKKNSANKGFEQLLGVHLNALEENSQSLVEILQILSEKKLSAKDKSSLKKISRELKSVDKKIDNLGKAPKIEEEKEGDWFEF
jgi:hypothetical protein